MHLLDFKEEPFIATINLIRRLATLELLVIIVIHSIISMKLFSTKNATASSGARRHAAFNGSVRLANLLQTLLMPILRTIK